MEKFRLFTYSFIVAIAVTLMQCNSLYKTGIIGDDWCMQYCDDENLKKQAKENYEKRKTKMPVENKASEARIRPGYYPFKWWFEGGTFKIKTTQYGKLMKGVPPKESTGWSECVPCYQQGERPITPEMMQQHYEQQESAKCQRELLGGEGIVIKCKGNTNITNKEFTIIQDHDREIYFFWDRMVCNKYRYMRTGR